MDAALKGSLCLGSCQNREDAANTADSSPDAQCQADILAISAAEKGFFSIAIINGNLSNIKGQRFESDARMLLKIHRGCKLPVSGFTGVSDSIRE